MSRTVSRAFGACKQDQSLDESPHHTNPCNPQESPAVLARWHVPLSCVPTCLCLVSGMAAAVGRSLVVK